MRRRARILDVDGTLCDVRPVRHHALRPRGGAPEATINSELIVRSEGVPQTRIAEELGVDRMTVRKWVGRR